MRLYLLAIPLLFLFSASSAQNTPWSVSITTSRDFHYGYKALDNYSKTEKSGLILTPSKPAFSVGTVLNYKLSKSLTASGGLRFTQLYSNPLYHIFCATGVPSEILQNEETQVVSYLEIPLEGSFQINPLNRWGVNLLLGTSMQFRVAENLQGLDQYYSSPGRLHLMYFGFETEWRATETISAALSFKNRHALHGDRKSIPASVRCEFGLTYHI